MILPDVLDYNLKIVFCGMAASKKSKEVKAYYAGPGNKFWKTLHSIGLTPEELKPEEFTKIVEYKIGLTDICKTDFGNDNELDSSKYDVNRFNSLMIKYQPKIICFNGKNAAKIYFNRKNIEYGIQSEKIVMSKIFIVPSTSGAASGFWDINIWKTLADIIK